MKIKITQFWQSWPITESLFWTFAYLFANNQLLVLPSETNKEARLHALLLYKNQDSRQLGRVIRNIIVIFILKLIENDFGVYPL
jgi:hypothetical protein